MAERRMLTKKVTDADEFIALPSSTQALYLHLTMGADDDGFNNQIQMAMFKAHASADDLKILMAKRFILQFESGVIVIKHWRMANALRKDRYTETAFKEEFNMLKVKDNGSYTFDDAVVATWLPDGCQTVATGKVREGKDRLGKDRIDTYSGEPDEPPTPQEPIFIKIPLIDKTDFDVTDSIVAEYQESYPGLDVKQKLRSMRQWCLDNPTKRKTRRGVRKFIGGWLEREQNRGGQRMAPQETRTQQANDLIRRLEQEESDEEE